MVGGLVAAAIEEVLEAHDDRRLLPAEPVLHVPQVIEHGPARLDDRAAVPLARLEGLPRSDGANGNEVFVLLRRKPVRDGAQSWAHLGKEPLELLLSQPQRSS